MGNYALRNTALYAGGAAVASPSVGLPVEVTTTVQPGLPLPFEVAGTKGVGLPFEVTTTVQSGLPLPFEVNVSGFRISGLLPLPFYFGGPVTAGLPLPIEAKGIDPFALAFIWNDLQLLDVPILAQWNVADIVFLGTLPLEWAIREILDTLATEWRVVPDVFTPFKATVTQPTTAPTTQRLVTSPAGVSCPFEHNFNPGTRAFLPWESN